VQATEVKSQDELFLIKAIDEMMRSRRMVELATGADLEQLNAFIQKHVEASFEYYDTFSKEDMTKMLLLDALFKGGEADDPE
jgi:hypothetical protein